MSLSLTALIWAGLLTAWIVPRWPVSLLQAAIFLLTAVWLIRKTLQGSTIKPHPITLFLACATAWPLLQLASGATSYRWETEMWTLYWLMNLAVFTLAFDCFQNPARRQKALNFTLIAGALLCIQGTIQLFTSPGNVFWIFPTGYRDLVIGPFVYKNQYAAFVELLIPIPFVLAVRHRPLRLVGALTTGFLYASVIASTSRAGAILVTLELVALALLLWFRDRSGSRPFAIMLAASLAFVAALGPEMLLKRFQEEDQFLGRREMFQSSIAMLLDHPLTGVGLGNWPTAYPGYATYDDGFFANQAHNEWMEWAVEGGIPFVLLIAAIALWLVPMAVRSLWGLGVIPFLMHCWVDYPTRKPALAAFFFFFAGILAAAGRDRNPPATLYYSGP